jgi:hypothetical protein
LTGFDGAREVATAAGHDLADAGFNAALAGDAVVPERFVRSHAEPAGAPVLQSQSDRVKLAHSPLRK